MPVKQPLVKATAFESSTTAALLGFWSFGHYGSCMESEIK